MSLSSNWQHRVLAIAIGTVGACGIVGNLALLGHRILGANDVSWHTVPWSFRFWEIELQLFAALLGVAWIAAALVIAIGRWKIGVSIVLVSVLLGAINVSLNDTLRSHFA